MPLDSEGREIVDGKPMALPVGFCHPPSLAETIRMCIRREMSRDASERGEESFEEADDFNVGDDAEELSSPYELDDEKGRLLDLARSPEPKAPAAKAGDGGGKPPEAVPPAK